jgi:hypothetical protein
MIKTTSLCGAAKAAPLQDKLKTHSFRTCGAVPSHNLLGILFLVAVDALYRRCPAPVVFGFVAGDTKASAGGWIMERRLKADRHGRGGRLGVAIGTGLLR